jgi:hypothetical protein
MTHAVLRTHLNTSKLIRFLADLAPVDGAPSQQVFAQRLGHWVSFTDAMTLYAALNPGAEPARAPVSTAAPSAFLSAQAELTRVRTAMVEVIQRSCSAVPGSARIKFPVPPIETGSEIAVPYAPFHRFGVSVHREMDAKVGPLRATVRQALATASPALRQLAALDAVFDTALSERERRLLATVPQLVEKRFKQLHGEHLQMVAASGQTDDSAAWVRPGAWLARFRNELCGVLLSQWDLRLQPVTGLVEAFGNEVNGQT